MNPWRTVRTTDPTEKAMRDAATGTDSGITSHETLFPGRGVTLFRRSVQPAAAAWARLALLHGYGDHSGRYVHFMQWLALRGIEVHALDFRGHGRSQGPRAHVRRWEDYLDDLSSFLDLDPLRPGADRPPLFVLGHSHGGLIAVAAGIRGILGDSRGCVLSAPYLVGKNRVPAAKKVLARVGNLLAPSMRVPNGLGEGMMSSDPEMVRDSRADPLLLHVATPRWYLRTLQAQAEVVRRAGEFRLPLLALAGDADPVADTQATARFFERAGSADKTLRLLPGLLHEPLREASRESIFEEILTWMRERAGQDPVAENPRAKARAAGTDSTLAIPGGN
jgi:alpha-beta hydrolase superfamily lysophospholipase